MNITKYQELTGITVPASDQARVTAQIKRTKSILENMLGYTLSRSKVSENYYEERGKAPTDFTIPTDDSTLLPPDDVVGAYRLFNFNEADKFFVVDPFTVLNSVKLVFVQKGEAPNGITLKTFDADELRVQVGRDGLTKYIQKCNDCDCVCECRDCVQLAVDADWLFEDCLPLDLQYLWTDMVSYYGNCKRDIKSETLGSHSYTKFNNVQPETEQGNISIIKRYAGPHGSVFQNIV